MQYVLLLIITPNASYLVIKSIDSPTPDFSLCRSIYVYWKQKLNMEIEIVLFLEFILSIVFMTVWLVWTGQNILTPE